MTEEKDTYTPPEHGWTCFHCGETFHHENPARAHFGALPDAVPGCLMRMQPGEHGLLRKVRSMERELAEVTYKLHEQDSETDRYLANIKSEHASAVQRAEEAGFAKGIAVSPTRAAQFLAFCKEVFPGVADQRKERAMRFLEEAAELAQACEVEVTKAIAIITRCFSREPGDISKEVAQCYLTLEIFHANEGNLLSLNELASNEADRCYAIPKEEWHRRHQAKTDAGIAGQIKT